MVKVVKKILPLKNGYIIIAPKPHITTFVIIAGVVCYAGFVFRVYDAG